MTKRFSALLLRAVDATVVRSTVVRPSRGLPAGTLTGAGCWVILRLVPAPLSTPGEACKEPPTVLRPVRGASGW